MNRYFYIAGAAWLLTLLVIFLCFLTFVNEHFDVLWLINETSRDHALSLSTYITSRWGAVCARQLLSLNAVALPISLIASCALYPLSTHTAKNLAASANTLALAAGFLLSLFLAITVYYAVLSVPAPLIVSDIMSVQATTSNGSFDLYPSIDYWFVLIPFIPLSIFGLLASAKAVLFKMMQDL